MLRGLADFDGHKVSYEFHPEFGGRIVEGLHGAEEGHPLTFRVENQIGYVADSIYVNGATFEADYVTDNDDGPHTAWYSVPEIYEEQEVEGYITETNIQPAVVLEPIHMEDSVIIYISADEGALPKMGDCARPHRYGGRGCG